jgi:hypothetical protein
MPGTQSEQPGGLRPAVILVLILMILAIIIRLLMPAH